MIDQVMDLREQKAGAAQLRFDYSQIEEQYRDEVKVAAQVIRAQGHAMRGSILKIGRRLIEVKGMLPHGVFGEWIAAEFGMSERMSQNMMNVAREYEGKSEIISFLSDTVLYLLAAPSTPEGARAEVEREAAAGQKVTVEFTKETIAAAQVTKAAAEFAPAKPPKPTPEPVQYATVHDLQLRVASWYDHDLKGAGDNVEGNKLSRLQYMKKNPEDHPDFLSLQKHLPPSYRKSDLIQALNNVLDSRRAWARQAANQASAKVVYASPVRVEPEPRPQMLNDVAVHMLQYGKLDTDIFKTTLESATLEELDQAWKLTPPVTQRDRFLKIGNRRELLFLAQQTGHVDALIKAAMPVVPEPKPSKIDIINRDLDAYEAEAKREAAEWQPEMTAPQPEPTPDMSELAAAWPALPDIEGGVDRFAQHPVSGEPELSSPTTMPADLAAAGYALIDTKPGPGWRWHKGAGKTFASGPLNSVAPTAEAAIADAREHYEAHPPLSVVAKRVMGSPILKRTLILDEPVLRYLHSAILINALRKHIPEQEHSLLSEAVTEALGL